MSESFDMVCIERDELRTQRDALLPALRALYGWIKAEVEYFGANSPDDFIIEMVEKALAGDGYGGCQIAALTAQRDELLAALKRIEAWNSFPPTNEFWTGSLVPVSYETKFGSNGARDFMRSVAREAIERAEHHA